VQVVLPGGLRLRGIVDRLDVAPSGDVRVVDYKTGRAPREAFEGKALFQMKFYALVLWRTTGTVPRLLQLMYLGDREVLRYVPDEADLVATERKLLALWAAIERATQRREFAARPSKLCGWCDHQALCPSFGGTPPPFPDVVPGPDVPLPHQAAAVAAEARRTSG
jgi:putative RecB family exonuclease